MNIPEQLRQLDEELREIQSALVVASGNLRNLIDVHRGIVAEIEAQTSQQTSQKT